MTTTHVLTVVLDDRLLTLNAAVGLLRPAATSPYEASPSVPT